ncbi:MAG: nicotinate-nucleotide--dimethylbenzimidazole phosphoribosyltransferase [Rhodobiaceae bacterium]|nr:nicotinate-nucleotide--dimethylbenzimidazole phosphoribosyltransferase [Rhodobiaceae bacterium]
MGPTGLPFDDIRNLLSQLPGPDEDAAAAVRARDGDLVKPPGSLGRLEEIAEWLARWQGKAPPAVTRPVVAIFAASHGVVVRGVAARPIKVNRQMVETFAAGGAAINQLCAGADLGLKVFDLALDMPSGDIALGPALDERDCAATIAYGMEAVAGGTDLLCLGEMGVGNTTIAAALSAALFGGNGADWAGRGTGIDDAGLQRKRDAVDAALAVHAGHLDDPLEVLRRLGGREFAAIAGAILAARFQRVPVILDGYAVTAAAAVLFRMAPGAIGHCLLGHLSAEPGHARLAAELGLTPLLDLGLSIGEGSGAALAAMIVKAAAATHAGMATFEAAGVSRG